VRDLLVHGRSSSTREPGLHRCQLFT
jgi:hypothetical protein